MISKICEAYVASRIQISRCHLVHREPKKGKHDILVHIFAKYWPIFTILSPTYSVANLQ